MTRSIMPAPSPAWSARNALDLADITFTNGTTTATLMNATSAGGTLHVTDGMHQANIALLGNFMASITARPSTIHKWPAE
jgi:hypothetical protein